MQEIAIDLMYKIEQSSFKISLIAPNGKGFEHIHVGQYCDTDDAGVPIIKDRFKKKNTFSLQDLNYCMIYHLHIKSQDMIHFSTMGSDQFLDVKIYGDDKVVFPYFQENTLILAPQSLFNLHDHDALMEHRNLNIWMSLQMYFDEEFYAINHGLSLSQYKFSPKEHFLKIGFRKNLPFNSWFDFEKYYKFIEKSNNNLHVDMKFFTQYMKNFSPTPKTLLPITNFFIENNSHVSNLNSDIMEKIAMNLYGASVQNLNKKCFIIQQTMTRILDEKPDNKQLDIPQIIHRLWITSPSKPCLPQVDHYLNSLDVMGDYEQWFWCLDEDPISMFTYDLKKLGIHIKTFKDIHTFMGLQLFNFFLDHCLFALASDIMRMNILYQYGGIYTDINWKIIRNFSNEIKGFSAIFSHYPKFGTNDYGHLDINFLGFLPKHPIPNMYLKTLEKLNEVPDIESMISPHSPGHIHWFSGVFHLSIIVPHFFFSHPILMIKPDVFVQPHQLRTWLYGSFGNSVLKDLKEHPLSIYPPLKPQKKGEFIP